MEAAPGRAPEAEDPREGGSKPVSDSHMVGALRMIGQTIFSEGLRGSALEVLSLLHILSIWDIV